jgi:chromate reductase
MSIVEKQFSILGIAGSTTELSYNRLALRAAQKLAPDNAELEIFDLDEIEDIHLFDPQKVSLLPDVVVELKNSVRAADAILFVTLEYENSIPEVLEDAINLASIPREDNVWKDKPVALMSVTISDSAKMHNLKRLHELVQFMNMVPLNESELIISHAAGRFDMEGNITDDKTKNSIHQLLSKLVAFSNELKLIKHNHLILNAINKAGAE